jgi:NAD(P)H-flavin reductase
MSTYLLKQRVGERQCKIRGPFGDPLLSPSKPLSFGSNVWIPSKIYYICGGSGLTPFLQLLSSLILPILEPLLVVATYNKTRPDEIELTSGDTVVIKDHFYDVCLLYINSIRAGHTDSIYEPIKKVYSLYHTSFLNAALRLNSRL